MPLFSLGQVDEAGEIVRDPNFPDIPTVVEVYRTLPAAADADRLRGVPGLLGLTYTYQKALWVPEDTPDEAVELLRRSAEEMGADPVFNAEADEVLGGYPIVADPRTSTSGSPSPTASTTTSATTCVDLLETPYDITID